MTVDTNELLITSRKYADHSDDNVASHIIALLCDRLEMYKQLHDNIFSRMISDKSNYLDAERYRWLRNGSWEIDQKEVAPAVVNCNGDMSEYTWLHAEYLDRAIDKWMLKDITK